MSNVSDFEPLGDASLAAIVGGAMPAPGTSIDRIQIGQGDLYGGGGMFAYGHARGTTVYVLDPAGALVGGLTNLRRNF